MTSTTSSGTRGFVPRLNTTRKTGQKQNSSPLFMSDDPGRERRTEGEGEKTTLINLVHGCELPGHLFLVEKDMGSKAC